MHRLLRRQLVVHFGAVDAVPEAWRAVVQVIDDTYQQADADRRLLERSLDLTSQELLERNAELRRRDLDARRRAERALAISEQRTAAILRAFPDSVALLHADGTVLAYKVRGDEPAGEGQETVGRNLRDLLPTKLADATLALIATTLAKREVQSGDYSLTLGGQLRHFEARLAVAGDQTVAAVVRDVTERKTMQERVLLAERMATVGTLAAGVAHEINNPLSYVLTNLDHVREELARWREAAPTAPLDDMDEALRDARSGAQRMRDIVRDLQIFARDSSLDVGPVDVHAVLDSSVGIVAAEIAKKAQLVKHYGPAGRVRANASRLGQVFLNLLVNAAQALPAGDAADHRIEVRTSCTATGEVVIEVQDTGPGIPEHVRGRIFDPFFTTKPVGVGTGLGLAICHTIVTELGGEISVQSTPGATCFRVRLPADRSAVGRSERPALAIRPVAPRARVLVIDDEPLINRSLARALRDHDLTIAGGGRDGLACLQRGDFDVVFCDIMMPDLSGVAVYQAACQMGSDVAERFVFMTGGTADEGTERFLSGVQNQRIEKPFDAQRVRGVVADRLRQVG